MGPLLQRDSARMRRLDWADWEMTEGMFQLITSRSAWRLDPQGWKLVGTQRI